MAHSIASSDGSTVSSTYARKLVASRPAITIHINNHFKSKVYSTFSVIAGTVIIEPEYDMFFDNIQILLMGITKTEVDSTAGPIQRQHLFLKLEMPITDDQMPVPRIFERGVSYTFPFHFVVPQFLTINACSHRAHTDHVRDAHLQLPPSMGYWPLDDMSPNTARVEYTVKARIMKDPHDHATIGKKIKLCETSHPIFIIPSSYEEAPLSICKEDRAYRMCRTKPVKKGMFSSKLGDLTMMASQPQPIVLQPDGRVVSSTTANIDLHFKPVSAEALPPRVIALQSKLVSHTYYSNDGFASFPNIGKWNNEYGQHRRGEYYTSVHLPSPPIPQTKWRQQLVAHARRDSGYGTESYSEGDGSERRLSNPSSSPIYNTTRLSVPVSLPTGKKMFIPTFHSCITSRIYVLHLTITVTSGSSTTNLSVAIPLQVAIEAASAGQQPAFGLPTFQDVVELEEEVAADESLMPRVLRIPEIEFSRSSELPGYNEHDRYAPVAAH